ncbi:MAG: BMP family protein [Halolamina sp.]
MSSDEELDRRTFVGGAAGAGLVGAAGCLGGGPADEGAQTTTGDDGADEETATVTATEGETTNVGMVYALGGLGDKSFNDAARRGVVRAEEELGISFNQVQPSAAEEFSQFQRRFAQSTDPNYDLVCCIGFAQQSALQSVSGEFPDQRFMLADAVVDRDNVANYTFREHEGSFQIGHMAGLLTTRSFSAGAGSTQSDSTNVGFVGGVDAPLIRKFQAGFEAGVAHADEDVDVQVSYTGSFSDTQAGKEAALSMYQSGADIVYHAAGATGLGVFQAAAEEGRFAVGVDSDQSQTEPSYADVILASMVKRVDTAVFEAIQSQVEANFDGGSVVSLGLEQNGVEAVYGESLGGEIPDDVKSALEGSREEIIAGDIEVPTEPN